MTKDEALTLEALKYAASLGDGRIVREMNTAPFIIRCDEALEQPEQEPVAYLCENAVGHKYFRWKKPSSTYKPIALYTTPPQRAWVGLTDEEVRKICVDEWGGYEQVRAIEAKLKEKNT